MSEDNFPTSNGCLEDAEGDIHEASDKKEDSATRGSLMLQLSGGFTEDVYSVVESVPGTQNTSSNENSDLLNYEPHLSSTPIMDEDVATPERRKSEERQGKRRTSTSDVESSPAAKRWTPIEPRTPSELQPHREEEVESAPTNLALDNQDKNEGQDMTVVHATVEEPTCIPEEPVPIIRTTQPSASPLAAHTRNGSTQQEAKPHPRPVDLSPATSAHDSLDLSQHAQDGQRAQSTVTSRETHPKEVRGGFFRTPGRPLQSDSQSSSSTDPPVLFPRRPFLTEQPNPAKEQGQYPPHGYLLVEETTRVMRDRIVYRDGKICGEHSRVMSRETKSYLVLEENYMSFLRSDGLLFRVNHDPLTTSSSNLADISSSSSPPGAVSSKMFEKQLGQTLSQPTSVLASEDALLEHPLPSKAAALVASGDDVETWVPDTPQDSSTEILPGKAVFASWGDHYFYPGSIKQIVSDKKCLVQFLDEEHEREVGHGSLLVIPRLPRGQSVMVKSSDDYYDPAIVRDYYRQGSEVGYVVEMDDGSLSRRPKAEVIMSRDQVIAAGLKPHSSPPPPGELSLARSAAESSTDTSQASFAKKAKLSTPTKKSPAFAKRTLKGTPKKQTPKKEDLTKKSPVKSTPSPIGRGMTTRCRGRPSAEGTKLFADIAFLLSEADKRDKQNMSLNMSLDEDMGDIAFDKKELRKLLTQHGGIVLDTFEEAQETTAKKIYLLAMTQMRTLKYVQCLASGIECLSHMWAINAVNAGELPKIIGYILPAGYSIIKDQLIDWHYKHSVFDKKTVLVTSGKPAFITTWSSVLVAAGATVVHKFPAKLQGGVRQSVQSLKVSYLVTDSTCHPKHLGRANTLRVKAVSSEWVIQCLIHGTLLPTDGHPKFKYSYTER
ncbi:TP53-binding protein 1-like isoform X2 [Ornithodoros turicata]|uniref:TP53-binding protein 1-like isoform X2 n=1 Tax=Ornithodoros turicata TaxID=34597 RepID=UPI00313966AC